MMAPYRSRLQRFGGIKESGYGREGSRSGLDEYLNIKYIRHGNIPARRLV